MDGAAEGSGLWRALGAPLSRRFWSLKAVNAVLGTALTVGTGLAQVGLGDRLGEEIAAHEAVARDADEHIRVIDAAVFEFKLFESNAALVQVLSVGGTVPVLPGRRADRACHGPARIGRTLPAEPREHQPRRPRPSGR